MLSLLVFCVDFVAYAAAARFLLFSQFAAPNERIMSTAAVLGLALAGLKVLVWRIWKALTIDRGYYHLTWDEWVGGYLDFTVPEKVGRRRNAGLLFGCEFIASAVLLWLLIFPDPQMVARVKQMPFERQSAVALFLSILLGLVFAKAGMLLRRIWEKYVFEN